MYYLFTVGKREGKNSMLGIPGFTQEIMIFFKDSSLDSHFKLKHTFQA